MTNIEILEAAAVISRDEKDHRRDAVKLVLSEYYRGSASIRDIETVICNLTYHEFLEELKGKHVYRSLVDLYEGKLSKERMAILVSSLLTHANIQLEQNTELTPSQLLVKDMLHILDKYYETGEISRLEIMKVVKSLGFVYKTDM